MHRHFTSSLAFQSMKWLHPGRCTTKCTSPNQMSRKCDTLEAIFELKMEFVCSNSQHKLILRQAMSCCLFKWVFRAANSQQNCLFIIYVVPSSTPYQGIAHSRMLCTHFTAAACKFMPHTMCAIVHCSTSSSSSSSSILHSNVLQKRNLMTWIMNQLCACADAGFLYFC